MYIYIHTLSGFICLLVQIMEDNFIPVILKPVDILDIWIILWVFVVVIPLLVISLSNVSKNCLKFESLGREANLCFNIYLNPSGQLWEVQIHFPQAQTLKHHHVKA